MFNVLIAVGIEYWAGKKSILAKMTAQVQLQTSIPVQWG